MIRHKNILPLKLLIRFHSLLDYSIKTFHIPNTNLLSVIHAPYNTEARDCFRDVLGTCQRVRARFRAFHPF